MELTQLVVLMEEEMQVVALVMKEAEAVLLILGFLHMDLPSGFLLLVEVVVTVVGLEAAEVMADVPAAQMGAAVKVEEV